MRPHLIRALVLALALTLAGCATSHPAEPTASLPQTAEAASSWGYFIDAVDNGDDIWTPGCHYKCSDARCSGPTEFWGGDWCSDNDLHEWTNGAPHAAESDIARYNCDEACKQKGAAGGRCVRLEKACNETWSSSHCACADDR
jgi:hypothetical protein